MLVYLNTGGIDGIDARRYIFIVRQFRAFDGYKSTDNNVERHRCEPY